MPTLNWIGKDEVLRYNPPYHTLEKKYTFNAKNSDNMIIKGDNLLALKALLPKYEGKIKCIYIDPPYNTGNENWVYNDNVNSKEIKKWLGEVVGKDDLSRHDKWLCMMLPRLKLLHRLLSDDGVIFISIDDNEMANLKLLCDEVMGGGNFVSYIITKATPNARDYGFFGKTHEFILVYAKNVNCLTLNTIEDKERKFSYKDEKSAFNIHPLYNSNVAFNKDNRPNLFYPFYINTNKRDENGFFEISLEKQDDFIEVYPPKSKKEGIQFVWRWGKEKSLENLNKEIIAYETKDNEYRIVQKMRTSEQIPRTIWDVTEFSNRRGTEDLQKIFDKKVFNYPKSYALVQRILEIATDKNSIILDSFAGSGTTAHAVLDLNKKDGGNRKFILVEMEDYAENITAERVRRVIKGYGKEPENSATSGDFSFYELGERLLLENGNLNEALSSEKIKEYIYFSETKQKYNENSSDFLGECNGVAYYFIYKKDEITTLDFEYLANLKKSSSYVIYADVCVLSNETMMKYNITFKKIPRDIKKV